jgi:ketosteroid isomerase-like protein
MTLEELVQRSYRAFNERDEATLRELYTPDCIWDGSNFPGFPGQTRYVGPEGLVEFIDEWWTMWEEFTTTPNEVVQGPNGVFVHGHLHARGRDGLELDLNMGQVAHVTGDGRISAVYNYADADRARRDAGL